MKNYIEITDVELRDNSSTGEWEIKDFKLNIFPATDSTDALNILKVDYTPQIGDKLFFLPGVNIPRVKLKELTLNYNIKTVRDINEATVIFGSKHSEGKMISTKWYYHIRTEDFKNCFEALKPGLDAQTIERVETALEFYTENIILGDWSILQDFTNDDIGVYRKNLVVNPGAKASSNRKSCYLYAVDTDYLELYKNLEGKTIIDESGLVDKLNGDDAIIITPEVFEQLKAMFQSSDDSNHVIAMEIMANSNYKESLLYLGMLFKEHSYEINNCSTRHHVNFKSLLSYFAKNKYNMQSSLDDIVRSLIEKEVLTTDKLDILMERYHQEIVNGGNTTFFKIKTITASEEILLNLNTNYKYSLSADYIPFEVEEKAAEVPQEDNIKWI